MVKHSLGPDVRVSIASLGDVAVAVAAERSDVGIAIERIEPSRGATADTSLSEAELALVRGHGQDEARARLLGAKESLSESQGQGDGTWELARARLWPRAFSGQRPVGRNPPSRRTNHFLDPIMSTAIEQKVLGDVARFIREVVAEEWINDFPIGMETSFSGGLELESIEFVALAEKLKNEYGTTVDFTGWLATMELKDILALQVGRLVGFIEECISKPKRRSKAPRIRAWTGISRGHAPRTRYWFHDDMVSAHRASAR